MLLSNKVKPGLLLVRQVFWGSMKAVHDWQDCMTDSQFCTPVKCRRKCSGEVLRCCFSPYITNVKFLEATKFSSKYPSSKVSPSFIQIVDCTPFPGMLKPPTHYIHGTVSIPEMKNESFAPKAKTRAAQQLQVLWKLLFTQHSWTECVGA